MIVVPLARTAAITAFSVPVTLISSSNMSAPCRPPERMVKSYRLKSICVPNASKASRCVSTRRRPMRSPPGKGRTARPNRPSIGPASSIEPRICWKSSVRGWANFASLAQRRRVVPSLWTVTPNSSRIWSMVPTSPIWGTLCSVTSPSVRSTAARIGSAAFLLPAGVTSPVRG